jgi:uncharacterized membrane protein YfcA
MSEALASTLAPFLTADYFWMALIVVVGACLQGAGGIGFGMFVGPVLAILHPELVPGPVLVPAGVLALMSALREFRSIDFPVLGYSLAGRLPASVAGGLVFALLPVRLMSVVFAVLILLAVSMSLWGWRVHAAPRNLVIAGAASGFMGTITSVGAPPMAIVYQGFDPARLRATIGAFFVAGAIGSLAALAWFDRFGALELKWGLALIVPMIAGFALSNLIVPYIERAQMRLVVLGMSGVTALALLLMQLV